MTERKSSLCIWLHNDGKLSSIFPSYLMRAFHINCTYTTNLQEANSVIGGRNLLRVPEHFKGVFLGAGLDRKTIRSFPLAKVINLLGHKTAECVLSNNTDKHIIMGDVLLLADLVYTRLQQTPGTMLKITGKHALLVVTDSEELNQVRKWKWVLEAEAKNELVLMNVATNQLSMLEVMEKIGTSPFVLSTDSDVMAIALSFNVPCCPVTLSSGDIFVWKDLYSAFSGGKTNSSNIPTVKRLKDDSTLPEMLSWCKTRVVGELKVLKANLQHQLESLRGGGGGGGGKASTRNTKAVPVTRRSRSLEKGRLPTIPQSPPKLASSSSRLSSFSVPSSTTTRRTNSRLSQTQVIPSLKLSAVSTSTQSSPRKPVSSRSQGHAPPPLPDEGTIKQISPASSSSSSSVRSNTSVPHIRSRSKQTRTFITNDTPRSN